MRTSRPQTPLFPLSPCPSRYAPHLANRLGLALNVGEQGRVAIALQPLLDEGPEDDLKAHRELEGDSRLPRNDPSPVQDVLGETEKGLWSYFRATPPPYPRRPGLRPPDARAGTAFC
jgi:hypothetical protein